ncbi:MAG: cellulase family glycosylhydrolase [Actinobacteria bacterium]|nr:cellulase family glycosylhydrolase [Actinomycetota bacterium]
MPRMLRLTRLAATLCALACLASAPGAAGAAAATPSLAVSGNQLIDTTSGLPFTPRGVNWPSFEYACAFDYGYSNAAGPDQVGPTAANAALLASWHINIVRIPLNQDCWLGDDGKPGGGLSASGYRDAVAAWVALLHEAGLAVILDLHWSGPDGTVADGQRMLADNRSPAFWSSVAARFKGDRAMIFDAFNEPYSRSYDNGPTFNLSWECWRDGGCTGPTQSDLAGTYDGKTMTLVGMRALVEAIRATGATQPIMLGGLDYANDLSQWLTHLPADGQLIASFHNYDGQRCQTQACWDAEIAPVAAQVPVITGEFGETDCAETHDVNYMNWADRHGIGYLMWQWVVLAPDELSSPPCASLAIIADAQGTPMFPNGTALKAHLDALAAGTPPPTTAAAPPQVSTAADRRAPRLGGLAIRRSHKRLVLKVTLDEPARLQITLTHSPRRRTSTNVVRAAAVGVNLVTVTRGRLRPGRYRLGVTATDGSGNRSAARTLRFTVPRPQGSRAPAGAPKAPR